ncbi:LOW QUALITY PROTEIN: Cysteine desulfurase [Ruminiclostridium papyrosolvens DSM 2782]|uniref:cysteine desulfurase n=1 Tax=Ruminiclostridium papyrosolvens DSM 2782 TaxID=588581 RepID=F1TIK5_9FIRM|nr:cysteine desulfurase family protein [Ruminiclostridium papyrosolvens]EGD45822.1 LOW QUALITY PROTEIN: Cysteine desulfurase [Ruminiclostridium papyrosolvens DSM 2782]WES33858.1 cysteine desulfurase family protein [Ruminiclostridium papyrosolvens DSM 2782]
MIYLDNSATTPVAQEVFEAMIPYLTTEYGNPSGKYYELAIRAKEAVEQARINVANLINAKPEEIIFTSGATESTNMIIKGVSDYKKYYEKKGNHIITTKVEHKATINTCKFLNGEIYSNSDATFLIGGKPLKVDRGFEVTFLDVNNCGQIEIEDFEDAIKDKTILASIIWGNNEIGSLNDISTLYQVCKNHSVLFHTDATQVVGKLGIDVKDIPVDFMSFSAHKLYGPKGIGAAYIKSDDYGIPPFSALLHGGEQESGMRGSTLAVHNIVGFGKAAEIALREREAKNKFYKELDEKIIKIISDLPNIKIIGDLENRIPGVYSIIVDKKDFNNERFLKKIGNRIALSSGSACTAGQPSHVLKAIGLGEYTGKVLRISVSYLVNENDIGELLSIINRL